MAIGLVGRKCGMSRIFTDAGVSVPVTVVEVQANRVTQVKSLENDGYRALQVTTGSKPARLINKSRAGQFAKAAVEAGRGLWEFRLDTEDEASTNDIALGHEFGVEIFEQGQRVDVTGTSKGKGFAGA
ncbi:unnamed protein product, partial [marine sediment metagenome]